MKRPIVVTHEACQECGSYTFVVRVRTQWPAPPSDNGLCLRECLQRYMDRRLKESAA